MKYTTIVDGQEQVVEVLPRENGYLVVVGDRALDIDAFQLQGVALSLIVGSGSYRCDIEQGRDGKVSVLVGESVYPLEILDERKLRLRRAAGKFTLEGPQRVDAPMPGKVTRVLVKVGDEVQEGQGLVVVEAMKMENELKSPKAGKVSELHAVEGSAVESGAKLVVVT
ncbi:MAG TPA: acetyl-CoA carboxylase biotin carboxyl carrier protein subunit [Myxococcales bacterium]|nr:acetyl-CoA carboxylase biotin carboxyl carrier protein subunit [Myxococcales bacterium]